LAGGDNLGGTGEHSPVHVTERDDFDGGYLNQAEEVRFTVPARAYETDPFFCFRHVSGGASVTRKSEAGGTGIDEIPAIHKFRRSELGLLW
jgi:hypothetical protein